MLDAAIMDVQNGDWVLDGDDGYTQSFGKGGADDADRGTIVSVYWRFDTCEVVAGGVSSRLDFLLRGPLGGLRENALDVSITGEAVLFTDG